MKTKSQSGSILLSTLSFIILLAIAAASVLELTMNSYKLTMRNEMRAQARSVAESELENVYFQWQSAIMAAVPANQSPSALSGIAEWSQTGDVDPTTMTPRTPFLAAHRTQGWVVKRSISFNPAYDFFDGVLPDSQKRGQVTYATVRIEVLPNSTSFFRNEVAVRVGRRFASSNSSIFQYGVFYEGDMEFAPGGNLVINGAIAANGSIYLAASSPGTLTVNKQVKYLLGDYFNQDSLGNTVLRKPDTGPGGPLVAPIFGTSQVSQVSPLSEPENLLGGVDATSMVSLRPDLFPTENDVYRSAILPPPDQTDEYPGYDSSLGDDPTINVQRMYTRAGLRVTVDNATNTVTFKKPDGTDVTASYAGVVVGTPNTPVFDQRETKNVLMTTIDMGALMTAIQSNYVAGPNDFNGAIYFNVKNSNTTTPRAVRLVNGANVYGRGGNGTSVTTNGGLYVQGDYNTTSPHLTDGTDNPAMLMADAITALSTGWLDTNAALDRSFREASGPMTINAGILTGNTPATSTTVSGGAQNLVRYLENWVDAGNNKYTVSVLGSLGCLFASKTFNSVFQQPGQVYGAPARVFTFDEGLLTHPPAGSPQTTAFNRGSFFVW